MKKITLVLASLFITTGIYASTVGITEYQSIKQKAMGGATILSEVNENALVNNPALLNEIDSFEFNILGFSTSIAADSVDTAKGIQSLQKDLDGVTDNSKIVDILKAYLDGTTDGVYNKDRYALSNKKVVLEITNVLTAFAKRGFGVGIFTAVNVNDLRLVNKPSSPEIIVDLGATVQVPIGMAFDFGKNKQYILGTSIKAIGGANVDTKISAGDLTSGDSAEIPINITKYTGLALDLGAVYKTKYLNYGLTIDNAFGKIDAKDVDKDNNETTIEGAKLPTIVNLAISNKYDKKDRLDTWWDKYAFWTLELKNITSADLNGNGTFDEKSFYKKIHFGLSSYVFNNKWVKLDLRGGLNQGYPTFGFGSEIFGFLNLDYAYTTRESGLSAGSKPETLHAISIDFRL